MMRFPSSRPQDAALSALVRTVAPAPVQVTYCASNALPFRVEWDSGNGPMMFFGLSPDQAAATAETALRSARANPLRPPVTEPSGNGAWAEAMRDHIADLDARRRPKAPALRLIQGGATRTR